jgi:hypothetical protein
MEAKWSVGKSETLFSPNIKDAKRGTRNRFLIRRPAGEGSKKIVFVSLKLLSRMWKIPIAPDPSLKDQPVARLVKKSKKKTKRRGKKMEEDGRREDKKKFPREFFFFVVFGTNHD